MLKMRTAPQRERFDLPKVRRGFVKTCLPRNLHPGALKMRTAPQRERFDPPKVQTVRFACSKCAPRHSESDLTHPKCAEGSFRMLKMRTAPQRERFDTPKVRRGFVKTCLPRNLHPGALKMHTAPQRERCDTPKVRRGFASRSQNVHRATARAISLSQSDVPATNSTPRHQSTAPATKFSRKAPECCDCHQIQSKRSKVQRLSRKVSLPQTQNHPKCWTCHEIQL